MKNSNYKILIVDDEKDILEFLSYNLKKEGYTVFTCRNGKDAVNIANKEIPHLILLDLMMPEIDGIETCEEIRSIDKLNNTIIAFLTARNEDYSQVAGFNAGADDYITKPVKPKVLISRIKALLKRSNLNNVKKKLIVDDDLIIDKEKYIVNYNNKEILLTRKEFNLLLLLVSEPGKVFTREDIYNSVWGNDIFVGDRTIDVHIRKLRAKLNTNKITTIKGVGYKYNK